jgi:predicted site-specific integrase-resolvase
MIQKQFPNELFTEREAAKYLRISTTTLWRERKKGKITFCRSAVKIVYTKKDLEKYLRSRKQEAVSCAA